MLIVLELFMFCLLLVFLACPRCMLMSGPFPRFLCSSPNFEKWSRFNSQGSFHDQKDLSNDMTTTPTWCRSHLQHMQPPPFMLSFCYTHFPSTFHAHTHLHHPFPAHLASFLMCMNSYIQPHSSFFLLYVPSYPSSNPFDSSIHLTHVPIIFNHPLFHA